MTVDGLREMFGELKGSLDEIADEIYEKFKGDPEKAPDVVKRAVYAANFLTETQEKWRTMPVSTFAATVCTMIDIYCSDKMLDSEKLAKHIVELIKK